MEQEKLFAMPFAKVYGCLVAKAERKGRTKEEVDYLISWLTGWQIETIAADMPYGDLFRKAPKLHPGWENIHGSICGIRVESIQDNTMRQLRCLDKLVDELAKGKPIEKILGKL